MSARDGVDVEEDGGGSGPNFLGGEGERVEVEVEDVGEDRCSGV